MSASQNGHLEIVEALLAARAEPDVQTEVLTAIHALLQNVVVDVHVLLLGWLVSTYVCMPNRTSGSRGQVACSRSPT